MAEAEAKAEARAEAEARVAEAEARAEAEASAEAEARVDVLCEEAWFYLGVNAVTQGPLDATELISFFLEGVVSCDTPVWCKTLGEWQQFERVAALTAMAAELEVAYATPPQVRRTGHRHCARPAPGDVHMECTLPAHGHVHAAIATPGP